MDSRLRLDSTSLPVGHPLVAVQPVKSPGKAVLPLDLDEIKPFTDDDHEHPVCFELMGMGDLEVVDVVDSLQGPTPRPSRPSRSSAKTSPPYSAWGAARGPDQPQGRLKDAPFMSFCSADWAPSEDSSDGEDFMKARMQECCVVEGLAGGLAEGRADGRPPGCAEDADSRATAATTASGLRSKLSVVKVVQVNILPDQPSTSGTQVHKACSRERAQVHLEDAETRRLVHVSGEVVDVDGLSDDEDDEDEVSRGAPTPDNTPEHSPSEEHQPGGLLLGLESGSALYSTLKGMALSAGSDYGSRGSGTPSPACSPETSPGATPAGTLAATATTASGSSGSTLGRVWSLILGRSGRTQAAQGSPAATCSSALPRGPRHSDSDEDDDSADDDALFVDPQTIEELEATLEEVRLDGDGDDPVVSYLVEEAEDAARSPGDASRDVTVEEVHEDDNHGVEHSDGVEQPDGSDGVDQELDAPEGEGGESRTTPAPKASGLLSRIFSRSKTSQDVTKADSVAEQPTRRTAAPKQAKQAKQAKRTGKGEVSNSDRLLHLQRMRPRQPNKAMRDSLSRILGRLLRQGKNGNVPWGVAMAPVGAEGDTGDTGVSPPLGLRIPPTRTAVMAPRRSALQQPPGPPPLQPMRRATAHTLPQSAAEKSKEPKEPSRSKYLEEDGSVGEKLLADCASQTDELRISRSTSQQSQKDSRPVENILKEKEDILTDVLGFI